MKTLTLSNLENRVRQWRKQMVKTLSFKYGNYDQHLLANRIASVVVGYREMLIAMPYKKNNAWILDAAGNWNLQFKDDHAELTYVNGDSKTPEQWQSLLNVITGFIV